MTTRVVWFRRDLRLGDHPALAEASEDAQVVPLFVVDPRLLDGSVRVARLRESLRCLDSTIDGGLVVRVGRPEVEVPRLAAEIGAASVHVSADFGPWGRRRDEWVARALEGVGVAWRPLGSPCLVAPGRVLKADGSPYRVFTPYYRAWLRHGWRSPASSGDEVRWRRVDGALADADPALTTGDGLPQGSMPAGEASALERWDLWRRRGLAEYGDGRNRPDLDGTSRMSAYLRWGEVHPRTLAADCSAMGAAAHSDAGPEAFLRELAFRDFYFDVLWHRPEAATRSLDGRHDTAMEYNSGPESEASFEAWCAGRTGIPFVDAGMRQLLAEGWMHNRVRMVVASFLVKDLHVPWWRGAAWFWRHLEDGDVASNSQGWQWTAGCGTDAAPYYRIFNPVAQGRRFDPDGDYVRRYVPELAGVPGAAVHEPCALADSPAGYPRPIVDHAEERRVALERFQALSAAVSPGPGR